MSMTAFRAVLVLCGVLIVFLGLNVALGGIPTMGWLDERPFLLVTDEEQYRMIDNHVRFFGGLFAAAGLFLIFAASNPVRFTQGILLVLAAIFIGGMARFSAPDPSVVLAAEIVNSLAAELVLMPLLAVWLLRLGRI
ncbi:DUF4345 domain-containing protein [uncultured Parvibaculum sp.]|uniref:DUF4345 domain-containing protein n=1 Tax=uncultured Parvibaculum sp. TaxID=291828 RepID=UPI0030DB7908